MKQPRSPLPAAIRAAVLALAVLFATGAAAQDASPGAATGSATFQKEFEQADKDKDGRLSEQEAESAGFFTTDGSFKQADRDRDGQVTLFELGDAVQRSLRQFLSDSDAADADKDGYVSEEEAKVSGTSILDVFKRADRDGDGKVARDEIDIFVKDSYYSETADRGVVPNIINKKF